MPCPLSFRPNSEIIGEGRERSALKRCKWWKSCRGVGAIPHLTPIVCHVRERLLHVLVKYNVVDNAEENRAN